jgi:peroxiredoxin
MGSRGRKLGVGNQAPEFQLQQFQGGQVKLSELRSRGPVLVAFYKVTCPTCQFTFPFLERMAHGSRVHFYGVSQDDVEATQEFRDDFRITFPTLLDSRKESYPASNGFGITHVPTLFLVEPDGRISWASEGFAKADLMELAQRSGVEAFRQTDYVPDFKAG